MLFFCFRKIDNGFPFSDGKTQNKLNKRKYFISEVNLNFAIIIAYKK